MEESLPRARGNEDASIIRLRIMEVLLHSYTRTAKKILIHNLQIFKVPRSILRGFRAESSDANAEWCKVFGNTY